MPWKRSNRSKRAPPIQQTGNVIRIGDTHDDPRYREISISYELMVPASTQVNSQTGSGDQRIGRVNGTVRAQTGSGDIEIDGAGGGLDAHTGSGDIQVNAVGGPIKAQTGSGDVDVAQTRKADVEVQTGSGDVRLTLPADAAFTLSARTGSGSIDTTHPVQLTKPGGTKAAPKPTRRHRPRRRQSRRHHDRIGVDRYSMIACPAAQ